MANNPDPDTSQLHNAPDVMIGKSTFDRDGRVVSDQPVSGKDAGQQNDRDPGQWMATQIIDHKGFPGDSRESAQQRRRRLILEMVKKERGYHKVDSTIRKWKREGIGTDGVDLRIVTHLLGRRAGGEMVDIDDDKLHRNPFATRPIDDRPWNVGGAGSDVEQPDRLARPPQRLLPDQGEEVSRQRPVTTEVAVDPPQIGQTVEVLVPTVVRSVHQFWFAASLLKLSPQAGQMHVTLSPCVARHFDPGGPTPEGRP